MTSFALFMGGSAKSSNDMLPPEMAAKVNKIVNASFEEMVFGFAGISNAVSRNSSPVIQTSADKAAEREPVSSPQPIAGAVEIAKSSLFTR